MRKGKKERHTTGKGIGQEKIRKEKKAKNGQGQRQAKERIRKKLKLYKQKKSIDKRQKKIVVTLQYIMSAVE